MLEIDTAIPSDPLDAAALRTLNDGAKILELHANRFRPTPEFNSEGLKICLECGELIPALRAAIADVTHCLGCQEEQEKPRRIRH